MRKTYFFHAYIHLHFITEIIIFDNLNRSCDIKEMFVQTISSLSKWKHSKRTRPRICSTFSIAIFSSAKWFYSNLYNTISYIHINVEKSISKREMFVSVEVIYFYLRNVKKYLILWRIGLKSRNFLNHILRRTFPSLFFASEKIPNPLAFMMHLHIWFLCNMNTSFCMSNWKISFLKFSIEEKNVIAHTL